jgi:hypothetical protein
MAGGFMPYRNVRYELADGVTTTVDHADAYRYPTATIDDARRVAKAFGVEGEVHDESAGGWSIGPSGQPDTIATRTQMFVGRNGTFSVNANGVVSSGSACAQVSSPDQPPQPCPTTTTTENPNLPTSERAQNIARTALTAAGVDLKNTTVKIERFEQVVVATFQPTFGGKEPADANVYTVSLGAGDEIVGAYGIVGTADSVGSYELASLRRAVDRLNANFGRGGGPEPAIAAVDQATVVKLTAVSVGLMGGGDAQQLWELPAYVFTTEDGNTVTAPAAADKYFPTTTTIVSSPSTGGGETKPPASDEVPPSPPSNR